jgi:formylglycine-generating enzyme required for sulfatase activity
MNRLLSYKTIKWTLAIVLGVGCYIAILDSAQAQNWYDNFQPGTVIDVDGFRMVYVPAATYEMGIDPDRLAGFCQQMGQSDIEECVEAVETNTGSTYTYAVNIPAFWLDQYEVTIAQFNAVCSDNYIWFPSGCAEMIYSSELEASEQQPQVGVTWMEAVAFCATRTTRLPTEEEWEYAASGTEKLLYPWGNEFVEDYARFDVS